MPFARRLLLLAILLQSLSAAETGLVRIGDYWRFFKGVTTPSAANQWTAVDFDDQGWLFARSGFSSGLGYGEMTQLLDYGATLPHHLFS
jgi:hypothetical protein